MKAKTAIDAKKIEILTESLYVISKEVVSI